MSADKPKDPTQQEEKTQSSPLRNIFNFFYDIVKVVFLSLRAIVFLIAKTPYILLPSMAHTSLQDDDYNQHLKKQLEQRIEELDLTPHQKATIHDNWIEQIAWTNRRATRERDANELIRWWLIILGVLIPVLTQAGGPVASTLVTLAGVFVAVLTAIYQFRRPEERWRHYRVINERYLNEIWNFITLAGEGYEIKEEDQEKAVSSGQSDHQTRFSDFHKRMMKIKQEDITRFFGEVVPPQESQSGTPALDGLVENNNAGRTILPGRLPAKPEDDNQQP